MSHPALRTSICERLGIEYPIIQAGMGFIARGELAAAASEAGGLGVIGSASLSPDELRDEIHKVRERTDRPFGVDILFAARGSPSTTHLQIWTATTRSRSSITNSGWRH